MRLQYHVVLWQYQEEAQSHIIYIYVAMYIWEFSLVLPKKLTTERFRDLGLGPIMAIGPVGPGTRWAPRNHWPQLGPVRPATHWAYCRSAVHAGQGM